MEKKPRSGSTGTTKKTGTSAKESDGNVRKKGTESIEPLKEVKPLDPKPKDPKPKGPKGGVGGVPL